MDDPAAPRLVTFLEPTEGAFTLVHPEGWRVQAGVVRGPFDPRPWYRALSPGGRAELRGSDPRVPVNFVAVDPAAMMMMPMPMPMPGTVPRPYAPPERFAEEYAQHFARELGAGSMRVTGRRDVEAMLRDDPRPEARPRVAQLQQLGAALAGVEFACDDRGLAGIVDVVTLRFPGPLGLVWSPVVTALAGPADAWPHARATLLAIARSYVTRPAWQQAVAQASAAQHQMTMETIATGNRILNLQAQSGMEAIRAHAQRASIAAETAAEVGAMRDQSWRAQQDSIDERHRRAVNGVRETVDVYDPGSGQVYRGAPAGFTTWWTDGADTVVASHGTDNPDAARLRQAVNLDEVPPPHRPRGDR